MKTKHLKSAKLIIPSFPASSEELPAFAEAVWAQALNIQAATNAIQTRQAEALEGIRAALEHLTGKKTKKGSQ
jgi:hypothetical protein